MSDHQVDSRRPGFRVNIVKLPALTSASRATFAIARKAVPPAGELTTETMVIHPDEEDAAPAPPVTPAQNGVLESEEYYYRWQELSARPEPLTELVLDPPESPDGNAIEGALRLELWVNEFGGVDRIELLDADTLPEEFKARAITTFSSAGFKPGLIDNQPVKSRMKIEVRYVPLLTSMEPAPLEAGIQHSPRSQRVESR